MTFDPVLMTMRDVNNAKEWITINIHQIDGIWQIYKGDVRERDCQKCYRR